MKDMNDYIKQELSDGKNYNEILENFQTQLTKIAIEAEQRLKDIALKKRKAALRQKLDEFFKYNGFDKAGWDELTLYFDSDGRVSAIREKLKKDKHQCRKESRVENKEELTFEEFLRDLFD